MGTARSEWASVSLLGTLMLAIRALISSGERIGFMGGSLLSRAMIVWRRWNRFPTLFGCECVTGEPCNGGYPQCGDFSVKWITFFCDENHIFGIRAFRKILRQIKLVFLKWRFIDFLPVPKGFLSERAWSIALQ
jgi:hypothetical protein